MNEKESFVARWLRLKQESGGEAQPDSAPPAAEPATGEDIPSAPAAFDPACLPPIESITQDSDIRVFLQTGVPAELMRAALRGAWAADPAIRDFVGVAESQWDFNDPAAMPGFGPLEATDLAQSFAAQAASRLSTAADAIAPMAETGRTLGNGPPDKAWASFGGAGENTPRVEIESKAPRRLDGRRRHGSALPKAP